MQFIKPDHIQKLLKLKTPEDIQNWRDERKKNFPTKRKREEIKDEKNLEKIEFLKKNEPEHKKQKFDKKQNSNFVRRKQPTLLEKMLLADVDRNENKLMEMIKIIVESDFLKKPLEK